MKDIIKALVAFRDERDWEQFHTPENLAKSITIEAAELLENYQWGEAYADRQNIKEELADVLAYTLLLCEHYGFDVETIVKEKMKLNSKKYPAKDVYGKADKRSR